MMVEKLKDGAAVLCCLAALMVVVTVLFQPWNWQWELGGVAALAIFHVLAR